MKKKIIFAIILLVGIFLATTPSFANPCDPNTNISNRSPEELVEIIKACEEKLKSIRSKINTLSSEIAFMNTQIYLTQLKINRTEKKIEELKEQIKILDSKIEDLDSSLDYLSKVFIKLVDSIYKSRPKPFFINLLLSQDFNEALLSYKYLKEKQSQNQRLMLQVQQTKLNFQEQKKLREEKRKELAELNQTLKLQKEELKNQQMAKRRLLELTKNDERTYQLILKRAKREYEAILAIVAGRGKEKKIKEVKKGETIAYVIPGPSCNSTGAHLHFIVKENDTVKNPFSYLKPVEYKNCSGSGCPSQNGDPFNPTGSWDWPLNPPITLTQGFGYTWALQHALESVKKFYTFHNGIDITSNSNDVKAVANGTLYKGSFTGSGGCALPYVKIVHNEGNIVTYYLHVYSRY